MPSGIRARSVGTEFRIVGKRIGAGNFGEVYLGENITSKERVAIKVEKDSQIKTASSSIRLRHEYEMLKRLYHGYPKGHKLNGIPQVFYFGHCGSSDCMVLELLGPNLEDLFELCGQRFSLKTTLMIGFQLLDRIESVHDRGLIYRDIKPENFLLGLKGSKEFNIIHLIDFGLATFYKDPVTNKHVPYKDLKTMTGTARYMSVHSHFGKTQSRRDDLESIGYVLVYFAKGRLPWQGIKTGNNIKEKYKKIRDSKMKVPVNQLCDGLPTQFNSYMTYIKKLGYTETPDYEYLKDLLHACYEKLGFSYDDPTFDWSNIDFPSDVQRFNKSKKRRDSEVSSFNTEASQELIEEDEEDQKKKEESKASDKNEKCEKNTSPKPPEKAITRRKSKGHDQTSWSANEMDDVLGDLSQIHQRASALGSNINNSKWNLKSLSSSDTQGFFGGSNSDIENTQISNSTNDLSTMKHSSSVDGALNNITNVNNNFSSQGYYSGNDDCDKDCQKKEKKCVKFNLERSQQQEDQGQASVTDAQVVQVCCCSSAEASVSEVKMTFLCFTWRRKRGDVSYQRNCELHNDNNKN